MRYITLISLLLVSACSVYHVDVRQGNVIDSKSLAQLKVGMTPKQVQFLLGTPMINDPFSHDRWDYLYYYKSDNHDTRREHHVVVYFKEGKVARINADASGTTSREYTPPKVTVQEVKQIQKETGKQGSNGGGGGDD